MARTHDCQILKAIQAAGLVLLLLFVSQIGEAAPSHQVCATCELSSLREALSRSVSGDTIYVKPGYYPEHDLVVSKSVRILATDPKNRPVINAGGHGNVFLITANGVEISGLIIRNSGLSYTEELAGIKVSEAKDCILRDNLLDSNHFGIYLARTQGCTLTSNEIRGAKRDESAAGNCIHVWYGQKIAIENNDLRECRDGIYLEFTSGSKVIGNRSVHQLRYGLHFMFSNDNVFRSNEFRDNASGVAVMYSKRIKMTNNRFLGSLGGAAYGLLLKDIGDSDIRGNTFMKNTVGVYMEGTTRTFLASNIFDGNGWALRILGNTDSNTIVRNDFLKNTFDLSTNATGNLNEISNNHWSRYQGLDLDRDGIGDLPYHPVQLSSALIETFSASVLLVNSFFFDILDELERFLPALTPASYVDPHPQMNRVTQ
jgi:nitrous oxidase accessory protein